MVTSTIGADAATETSSVSLPSDDTSSLLGTTPPTPIATTMTMTMTKESAGIECLDEREATPKPHRYSGSDSRGHKSYDGCQIEGGTSGLAWWGMIPMPPALLLWSQSMIVTFALAIAIVRMVRGYIQCPQPRDPLTWKLARDIRTWFDSVDYVQCLVQCYA
jgi:hypothetical protein